MTTKEIHMGKRVYSSPKYDLIFYWICYFKPYNNKYDNGRFGGAVNIFILSLFLFLRGLIH